MIARNSEAFLDLAAQLLGRGHRARFRAEGGSMHPSIRAGEAVVVEPVAPTEVRAGDVLLYRGEQRLTAHRVVGIDRATEAAPVFTLRGDAAGLPEERVESGQILGRVVEAERRGWGERLVQRVRRSAGWLSGWMDSGRRETMDVHAGGSGRDKPGLRSIIAHLGLASMLLGSAHQADAATRTWTGGGANGNWTTAQNWGGTAPVANDSLVFPTGAAQLSNTNDYTAGTAFGTISITGAGYTLAGTSLTTTGATDSAASGTTTVSLVMGGTGSLTKSGAGTLTLPGANTYSGGTALSAGTLSIGNNTALGTGTLTITGGTIIPTVTLLNVTNAQSWGGNFSMTANTGQNGTLAYSGAVTVTANVVVTNTQVNNNTIYFTGSIDADAAANNRTLTVTGSGSGNMQFGSCTIGGGQALKSLTLAGINEYATGAITLNGVNGSALSITAQKLTLNSTISTGAGTVSITASGGHSSNDGIYATSATIIQTTTGNITLAGTSSSAAGTVTGVFLDGVPGGTVTVTSNSGDISITGTGAGASTGSRGIRANSAVITSTSGSITLEGRRTSGSSGQSVSSDGTTTLGGGSGNVTFITTSGDASTWSGVISGTGQLIKQGTVGLTLSGLNTYTGATTVSAGTLKAGVATTTANGAFGNATAVTTTNAANAILEVNGFNNTIGSLAGGGTTGGNVTFGSAATLTAGGNNASTTYAGVISGTGGAMTKVGTGTLTLSNAGNGHTGATTITAGELRLNPVSTTASYASQVVLNGGTLATTGIATNTIVSSTSTLQLTSDSNISLGSNVHSLKFAASSGVGWTADRTLIIAGWAGPYNGGGGTAGKLFVGTAATGLSSGQSAQILFSNGTSLYTSTILSTGEVVPTATIAAPTQIRLQSFTATPDASGNLIQLITGREVNNLGFNLYREEKGQKLKLNASLLAGTALIGGAGTTFTAGQTRRWRDSGVGAGAVYWLEEVDLSGKKTWYGPAVSKLGAETDIATRAPGTVQMLRNRPVATGSAGALDDPDIAVPLSSVGSVSGLSGPNAKSLSLKSVGVSAAANTAGAASPAAVAQQYTLAAGPAVRLEAKAEGWYRITQPQLVAAGISAKTDPRKLQLYVNGMQQPILVAGEEGGKFDPTDAVLFYGRGIDTVWSDTQSYWLVAGAAPGLRMSTGGTSRGAAGVASFPATVDWKPRTIYFTELSNGDRNNFFGPIITDAPTDQPIVVAHYHPAGGASLLRVRLQGATMGPHAVAVSLNGRPVGAVSFRGQANVEASFPVAVVNEGPNTLTLTGASPDDVTVVDDVQLTYPHSYLADGDQLRFTAPVKKTTTIGGFGTQAITVLDITDPANPSLVTGKVSGSAPNYAFTIVPTVGTGTRTLLAVTDDQIKAPAVTANRPSSWHAVRAGYDLVILGHASLLDSAAPLAALRTSKGLKVARIDVQDIYDEFSFGVKTPFALRNFLATAKAGWTTKPRFVLLLGNGTFDPRNFMDTTVPDLLPVKLVDTAFLETASDDWFVDFNEDGLPELAIGRLPAESAAEADLMVARIVGYDATPPASWKNEALLVTGAPLNEREDFAPYSASVAALLPRSLTVTNVFQASDPDPYGELLAGLNAGKALVNYVGHGSNELWSGLFDSTSALELANDDRTPVFLAMTCLNGFIQDLYTYPLAKALIKAQNGGAVAVWASSGLTEPEPQSKMNQAMIGRLYGATPMTLGEAAAAAKAATTNMDVRRTWILLGDPSMVVRRAASP